MKVPISIRFQLLFSPLTTTFFPFDVCVCGTFNRKTNLRNIEFTLKLPLMMRMSTWMANQGEKNNKINRDPWFFNRPWIYLRTLFSSFFFVSFFCFYFHYFFIVGWCECVYKYRVCAFGHLQFLWPRKKAYFYLNEWRWRRQWFSHSVCVCVCVNMVVDTYDGIEKNKKKEQKQQKKERERKKWKSWSLNMQKFATFIYLLCFMRFSLIHWYWSVLDFGFGFVSLSLTVAKRWQFSAPIAISVSGCFAILSR